MNVVDQVAAFRETVRLAEEHQMPEMPGSSVGLAHLRTMAAAGESSDFPPDKLGRWLGWAQCAVVVAGVGLTLDDMKNLNATSTAPEVVR